MHRIDSTNARADQNGEGKAGFSDNQDLHGHDATYLTPDIMNTLQEEVANVVEGFGQIVGDKSNNAQLFTIIYALSGRIQLLENKVHEDVQVGSVFITTINFDNSDAVRAHKGYGRWQRLGDGHALVARARSGNLSAPSWMFDLGGAGGEYRHQLTTAEMARHGHSNAPFNKFGSIAAETTRGTAGATDSYKVWSEYAVVWMGDNDWANATEKQVGGNQPFNVVQPSLAVDVWLRLADTPSELEPTYELTANRASMSEGDIVVFTLNTTQLSLGSVVPWQIIGVNTGDVVPDNLFGAFTINASGRASYALKAVNAGTLTFSLVNVPNQYITIDVEPSTQESSPYDQYPVAEWFYQSGGDYTELRDDTTLESPEHHVADYHRKQTTTIHAQIYCYIHVIRTVDETISENTYQISAVTDQAGLVVIQLVNNIGDTTLEEGETMSIYIGYFEDEQNEITTPINPNSTIGDVVHEFHFNG